MFPIRRNTDDSKHISAKVMYCVLLETSVVHCGFSLCHARKLKALERHVHQILLVSANRPARNTGVAVHVKGAEVALTRLFF
jgi:hypothetical protein